MDVIPSHSFLVNEHCPNKQYQQKVTLKVQSVWFSGI